MSAALIWPVAAAIGLFFGSVSWKLREHSRRVDALAALPVPPSPGEVAVLAGILRTARDMGAGPTDTALAVLSAGYRQRRGDAR